MENVEIFDKPAEATQNYTVNDNSDTTTTNKDPEINVNAESKPELKIEETVKIFENSEIQPSLQQIDCHLTNISILPVKKDCVDSNDSVSKNVEDVIAITEKVCTDNNEAIESKETIQRNNLIDNNVSAVAVITSECLPKSKEMLDDIVMEENASSTETEITNIPEIKAVTSSLDVIASAYDSSDTENEEDIQIVSQENTKTCITQEMEVQITKEYRSKPVVLTSDEDSEDGDDSSSSSSSSSSNPSKSESEEDEDSDSEANKNKCKKKNQRNSGRKAGQEREMKGEFDDLPPIEDLTISVPEVLCDPLGEVAWMVEQMVVVRPKPGKPTLNLDTILFVERGRRVLGRIFDVFGQVSDPHYCVRFNSSEHIKESDVKVGMIVYFCPNTEYTSVVFVQDLLKMKATDELGEDEHPEFSDDEEERAYYAALKQKQKNEKTKTTREVPQKRQRIGQDSGWKSNHPWSSSGKKQQQQGKMHGNIYKTQEWSDSTQSNAHQPTNLWQHPSAYPNNSWPSTDSYQGNVWPAVPQNTAYCYSNQFDNHPHPQGTHRPFFRPPHAFQAPPVPYMQSRAYAQQSNPRYPETNFPWQSQDPRQSGMPWPLSPPPPPPPPGI